MKGKFGFPEIERMKRELIYGREEDDLFIQERVTRAKWAEAIYKELKTLSLEGADDSRVRLRAVLAEIARQIRYDETER